MRMNLDHVASGHFVLGRDVLCEFDYWPWAVEETINIRTPTIIGRSYTETKPLRYWVMPLKGRWSPPYPATEKWSSIVNPRLR